MAPYSPSVPDIVTHEEKRFFKELGGRIAQLRKEQNLTQQQLADELGVAQQVVASYEIGRRRVPVSTLPALARVLGVSIEALIGEEEKPAKRGPASMASSTSMTARCLGLGSAPSWKCLRPYSPRRDVKKIAAKKERPAQGRALVGCFNFYRRSIPRSPLMNPLSCAATLA